MTKEFFISESACKRLSFLLEKKNNPDTKLRISVEGGGCAGFQYEYKFVNDSIQEDDLYIEQNGAKILIDAISLGFIQNSTLDYIEGLEGSYFTIKNPQAASGCGCGNSFNLKQ